MTLTSTMRLKNSCAIYFGKIPSRGDFVKSASGTRVISLIDNWVAQGMELLLAEPGWKSSYDAGGTTDFLFIGTRKKHAIVGYMTPSSDASSRRFPFIAATLFELDDALPFLPISPLVMEKHGNHQRNLMQHAARSHDAAEALNALNDFPIDTEVDAGTAIGRYRTFLANTTLGKLESLLTLTDSEASGRQMVLAVGYLLQPVLTNYATPPQRGLCLPLPKDPFHHALVKAFWLDLISTFLPRTEFELSVLSGQHFGRHKLFVAFNGVPPGLFQAIFDEQASKERLIDIGQSGWVEEYAMNDLATIKLSSYLNHPELSLEQLVQSFRQGFAGQ